jgi:hypothetical protein
MQADRTDLGAISSFAPPKPCGCFFETVATGETPDACTVCEADTDCDGDNKCNYGFCEAYRANGEAEG